MNNEFLQAALNYAVQGFRVFPLAVKGKKPLTKNGFKDASFDEVQIREWWEQYPNANVGIATGEVSGIVVIDLDDGDKLPNDWPEIECEYVVKTSQGFHLYFKYPAGQDIKSRSKLGGHKIDIRANGGYIVAPPSIHESGVRYEFIT